MASSVRSRTASASIPGTAGAEGAAAVDAALDPLGAADGVPPHAPVSAPATAIASRRRLMERQPKAGALPVAVGQPGHHPAGLHPDLQLLLRIGRRPLPWLTAVEVERRAVPRADQALAAADGLDRALVQRARQVRARADEGIDARA